MLPDPHNIVATSSAVRSLMIRAGEADIWTPNSSDVEKFLAASEEDEEDEESPPVKRRIPREEPDE